MKTKLLIIIAIIMFILIGGTVTGVAILNRPSNIAARAITGVAEDFMRREEIKPIFDVLKSDSAEFTLGNIKTDKKDYSKDLYVSGKLYFAKDSIMLEDFYADLYGTEIYGEAYASKDTIYIYEENILHGAYGADTYSLADELEDSIFAADSKSNYALEEKFYNKLISIIENIDDNKELEKDSTNLTKVLLKDLWKIIIQNADISSENTTTRLNATKTKVRLITITVDDKAMENILWDTYDYLCDSEDILEFIDKHDDELTFFFGDTYKNKKYTSLYKIYDAWLEDLEEEIEATCDNIDKDFETINVNIATPKARATLLKLDVEIGDETVFSFNCGNKGIRKTDTLNVEFGNVELCYEVEKNKGNNIEITFDINSSEYQTYSISIDIDTKDNDYTATFVDSYNTTGIKYQDKYVIKGTLAIKGAVTTLTIDKINNNYTQTLYDVNYSTTSNYKLECEFIFNARDKMPSPITSYKSISSITENHMKEWEEKIKKVTNKINNT